MAINNVRKPSPSSISDNTLHSVYHDEPGGHDNKYPETPITSFPLDSRVNAVDPPNPALQNVLRMGLSVESGSRWK